VSGEENLEKEGKGNLKGGVFFSPEEVRSWEKGLGTTEFGEGFKEGEEGENEDKTIKGADQKSTGHAGEL